ncbi:MAG: hypothetical protein QM780_17425 [Hyphomicrobium sp.]|uniref:hypothetical protein n=1 Tax=Hyphomicrobium sp. TaxID=82 RepID=UPI0039E5CE09
MTECALSIGSQLSAHALCIATAFSNVVVGGLAIATGHNPWTSFLIGTTIYSASLGIRALFNPHACLPSLKTILLGLALGVAATAGLDRAGLYDHRQELANWYSELSDADRKEVRLKVRRWMDEQSVAQQAALTETAQVMGYAFAEDYVILNYCSPSNKELAAIWKGSGRG